MGNAHGHGVTAVDFVRILDKQVSRSLPMMERSGVSVEPFTCARFTSPADPLNGSRVIVEAASMNDSVAVVSISTVYESTGEPHDYCWTDTWAVVTYTLESSETIVSVHDDTSVLVEWLSSIANNVINGGMSASVHSDNPQWCTEELMVILGA